MRNLKDLMRRVQNICSRGVVRAISASLKMQGLQVLVLRGEVIDGVEHAEPYGFTSHPLPGAEAFMNHLGADRSHAVALVVADRRHRPTDLQPGEVCLYNCEQIRVHLTETGLVIDGGGLPILFKNTPQITFDTPLNQTSGEVMDRLNEGGKTMSAMRQVYDAHTHPENNDTTTSPPDRKMGGA